MSYVTLKVPYTLPCMTLAVPYLTLPCVTLFRVALPCVTFDGPFVSCVTSDGPLCVTVVGRIMWGWLAGPLCDVV